MIAVDSSVLVAIVFGEPEGAAFYRRLGDEPDALVSAVSVVEAGIVVEARAGAAASLDLERLVSLLTVADVDAAQARAALAAWRRFGKGRHPAGLNLGDCFSYALAQTQGVPLLFKGMDFAATDIAAA